MAAEKKLIEGECSEAKDGNAGKAASEGVEKQAGKTMEKTHGHGWTYCRAKADVPKGYDPFPGG